MKEDGLEQLMAAYQQAGDAQKTIDTANRILQVNPNNLRALALLSAYNRQHGDAGRSAGVAERAAGGAIWAEGTPGAAEHARSQRA